MIRLGLASELCREGTPPKSGPYECVTCGEAPVTRVALAVVMLGGATGWADLPAPNAEGCFGLAAGAPCKTDNGSAGACVATTVTRPDYSQGPPPTYKQVELLVCVSSARATRAFEVPVAAWLGAALAALAGAAAWLSRQGRRRPA